MSIYEKLKSFIEQDMSMQHIYQPIMLIELLKGEGSALEEDIAELVRRMLLRKSEGVINAVSGEVVSFRELAEYSSAALSQSINVRASPRKSAMPHNGFRAFDNASISKAFPGYRFRSWREGLDKIFEQLKKE